MKKIIIALLALLMVLGFAIKSCEACTDSVMFECTNCVNGEILDWDSIKTGRLRDTPRKDRRYTKCPKCDGVGWIRKFIKEEKDEENSDITVLDFLAIPK